MKLLALTLAAVMASPSSDRDEGVKAFAEGRYEDAARILGKAYRAEPDAELLFAWAQAERYAGHCDEAVPLFREFLAGKPAADVRKLAREAIVDCGEDPDAPTQTEDAGDDGGGDDAVPPPPPDGTTDPGSDRPPRGVLRDPLGHALTWPGVALIAVGGGLLGEAHGRRREAEAAPNEQAYRDALSGAPALSRAGVAVLALGGALTVAGVVRFAVVAGREGRDDTTVRWTGTGVVWKFELAPRRGRALR